MQGRSTRTSVSSEQHAAFEAALLQFCAAVPTPTAVFDAADDALICTNSAFRAEFGNLPTSRTQFEQNFEPVGAVADEAPGREVYCPFSSSWYSFHWSTMRAPDDSELMLLSAQNLTERMETMRQHRTLQEQLLSSSRVMSVGEMTTTLAHEINQPLATIVNCLTTARALLGQRGAGGQRLGEALELAFEQAGQAAAVVARVRQFVRTREPRREPLILRALVDHVIQLQQVDAQKHRVRVTVAVAEELPQVMADRVMIEQVLTNLVKNAIEAMRPTRPTERVLTISAQLNLEGRVAIRVTDRGPGISAAEEAQLFTPFFTTKREGMGIGLAICRSIIEYHEGHLYFERNAAGGSAFTFTLPVDVAP